MASNFLSGLAQGFADTTSSKIEEQDKSDQVDAQLAKKIKEQKDADTQAKIQLQQAQYAMQQSRMADAFTKTNAFFGTPDAGMTPAAQNKASTLFSNSTNTPNTVNDGSTTQSVTATDLPAPSSAATPTTQGTGAPSQQVGANVPSDQSASPAAPTAGGAPTPVPGQSPTITASSPSLNGAAPQLANGIQTGQGGTNGVRPTYNTVNPGTAGQVTDLMGGGQGQPAPQQPTQPQSTAQTNGATVMPIAGAHGNPYGVTQQDVQLQLMAMPPSITSKPGVDLFQLAYARAAQEKQKANTPTVHDKILAQAAGIDLGTGQVTPYFQQHQDTLLSDVASKGYNVGPNMVATGAKIVGDEKTYQQQMDKQQEFLKNADIDKTGEAAEKGVTAFENIFDKSADTSTGVLAGSKISQVANKIAGDPNQSELAALIGQAKAYAPRPGNRIFASELAPGGLLEQETASLSNPQTANMNNVAHIINSLDKTAEASRFYETMSGAFPFDPGQAKIAVSNWAAANPRFTTDAQGNLTKNQNYVPLNQWDFQKNTPLPQVQQQRSDTMNTKVDSAFSLSPKEQTVANKLRNPQ